jgi:hypothetical protein
MTPVEVELYHLVARVWGKMSVPEMREKVAEIFREKAKANPAEIAEAIRAIGR